MPQKQISVTTALTPVVGYNPNRTCLTLQNKDTTGLNIVVTDNPDTAAAAVGLAIYDYGSFTYKFEGGEDPRLARWAIASGGAGIALAVDETIILNPPKKA